MVWLEQRKHITIITTRPLDSVVGGVYRRSPRQQLRGYTRCGNSNHTENSLLLVHLPGTNYFDKRNPVYNFIGTPSFASLCYDWNLLPSHQPLPGTSHSSMSKMNSCSSYKSVIVIIHPTWQTTTAAMSVDVENWQGPQQIPIVRWKIVVITIYQCQYKLWLWSHN